MNDLGTQDALPFTKMHGIGNDIAILESRGAIAHAKPTLVRALGDRHRGVGFDQLAEIRPSRAADLALEFWNADGSRAGACGNATRCVASMVMGRTGRDALTIATEGGVLAVRRGSDGRIHVNMGPPQTEWARIPLARAVDTDALPLDGTPSAVGMGNPHCVFFVDDVAAVRLTEIGPRIEHDPLFPERTNVEFVEVHADGTLRLRVWERGAGVTLACGSGACAALVAAHRRGLTGRAADVVLDGGTLRIDWRDDRVWMAGPAAHVFDGVLSADFLASVA